MKFRIFFLIGFICLNGYAQLPKGFVYLKEIDSTIKTDIKYYTTHNFVGKRINGYNSNKVIVSKQTADALKKIQSSLKKEQLSLKIYDAYRPERAVKHFWNWALQLNDTLMKKEYYPNVAKKELFKLQYIAKRSGHSRGSTVDVTLVDLKTNKELDMGTPYDFFGEESWVNYSKITLEQQKNRKLLQRIMLKNGFKNYYQEWWHFTLIDEPFKNNYFDFEIN